MPIRLIVKEKVFTPEEVKTLTLAFENTLRHLGWVKRDDEVALVIARQIVTIAAQGERDPQKISKSTLSALRLAPINCLKYATLSAFHQPSRAGFSAPGTT